MNLPSQPFSSPNGQRGAVLFVSLAILIVLSLFAMLTANTSIMESKMVGSARNVQLAQFAADSALNDAKVRIAQIASVHGAAQVCTQLPCLARNSATPLTAADFMQSGEAKAAANPFRVDLASLQGADETARVAALPVYVIEDLGATAIPPGAPPGTSATHAFRISAKGVGGSADYQRFVDTVFTIKE